MIRNTRLFTAIFLLIPQLVIAGVYSSAYNNPVTDRFAPIAPHQPILVSPEKVIINSSPVDAIQASIIKLNQLTSANIYSPQMMGALIDDEVAPMFDFNHIGKEVLAATNFELNAEISLYFSTKLRANIIRTLLSRLSQANSTSVQFISARPFMGNKVSVQLKVVGYSRNGIYLDLLFHQNNVGKWQIFDIVLNQDSLINYYQKMVSIKLRRYGFYGMLSRV